MLERAGSTAFDFRPHGGDASRIQWYFLDQSGRPVAVQLWELPPGGTDGVHAHAEEQPLEELYPLVEGTARMEVDCESPDMGPVTPCSHRSAPTANSAAPATPRRRSWWSGIGPRGGLVTARHRQGEPPGAGGGPEDRSRPVT